MRLRRVAGNSASPAGWCWSRASNHSKRLTAYPWRSACQILCMRQPMVDFRVHACRESGYIGGIMRKATAVTILVVLGLTMAGCGSSTSGGASINGNWTASLTNPDGSIAYQFLVTFTQGTGGSLNITNFSFTLPGSCFGSGEYGPTATFTPSGTSPVAGTFGMSIASPAVVGPALGLQGALTRATITGTWRLGSGVAACSGNGTFVMQPSVAG